MSVIRLVAHNAFALVSLSGLRESWHGLRVAVDELHFALCEVLVDGGMDWLGHGGSWFIVGQFVGLDCFL